jgi:tRNA-modifying protein YgfZ
VPELRTIDHNAEPAGSPSCAMSEARAHCRLDDMGVLQFSGPDARNFLQGQLSNDLSQLAPGSLLRAGLHNPQGRTLALLWLLEPSPEEILALLPLELLPELAARLRRYLLRSKLSLSDVSTRYRIFGQYDGRGAAPTPEGWVYAAGRSLLLHAAGTAAPSGEIMARERWRALDIADGLPQVYAPTAAQFIAQMLNLDCIDAISFTKGCYTGQEVIARAHYRGRVKRRMQRFESTTAAPLAPGDSGQFDDGRAFRIIDSVLREDGQTEFLAVAPLAGSAQQAEDTPRAGEAPSLPAVALTLPYALPD